MKKTTIIITIAAIIAGIAFFSQRKSAAVVPTSGIAEIPNNTGQNQMQNQALQSEFSTLLSSISGISIDTSILQNPAFRYLLDQPVLLGTDVIGRTNPFAPVGTDSTTVGETMTVKTIQPGKVTARSAEFGAQVVLSGTAPATVVFEYGTSDIFGGVTAPTTLTRSGTALFTTTTLVPNTTYVVRAILVRGADTVTGDTMSFTTRQVIQP